MMAGAAVSLCESKFGRSGPPGQGFARLGMAWVLRNMFQLLISALANTGPATTVSDRFGGCPDAAILHVT